MRMSSSKNENMKIVIKKKKPVKSAARIRLTNSKTKGLPSLATKASVRALADRETQQQQLDDTDDDDAINTQQLDEFDTNCNEAESDDDVLSGETFMVIQSLGQNPQTCISIPILPHNHNTTKKITMIPAVLECQLHTLLGTAHQDFVVSRQLQDLQRQNRIRVLQAPTTTTTFRVFLLTDHYIQGAQTAAINDNTTIDSATPFALQQWFVRHLCDWTTVVIAKTSIAESFQRDPLSKWNLPTLLDSLVHAKLLLPTRQHHNNQQDGYILWLPSWGTVLKAWNTACNQVLANLRRSYYKELSRASLNQPYSPIPTTLVIDWLVSTGQVQFIERPSGLFVKLI